MKKVIFLFLAACFSVFTDLSFAEGTPAKDVSAVVDKVTAEGLITEIAADQTYIIVGEGDQAVKFMTTAEFLESAYLEVGDRIKAYGEKEAGEVKLFDYEYVIGEDYKYLMEEFEEPIVPESAAPESEQAPGSEQFPESW